MDKKDSRKRKKEMPTVEPDIAKDPKCDIVIYVAGKTIPAKKSALADASPFFEAMFKVK